MQNSTIITIYIFPWLLAPILVKWGRDGNKNKYCLKNTDYTFDLYSTCILTFSLHTLTLWLLIWSCALQITFTHWIKSEFCTFILGSVHIHMHSTNKEQVQIIQACNIKLWVKTAALEDRWASQPHSASRTHPDSRPPSVVGNVDLLVVDYHYVKNSFKYYNTILTIYLHYTSTECSDVHEYLR